MVFSEISKYLDRAKTEGVAILGAGITGRSAAALLGEAGIPFSVFDERAIPASAVSHSNDGWFGEVTTLPEGYRPSFFLPSPGISPTSPLVRLFLDRGVPALSELDLFTHFCGGPAAAVTGTNGKSTTTTLLTQLLNLSALPAEAAGNIGAPLLDLLITGGFPGTPKPLQTQIVAELSSYQLEWSTRLAPRVAIWLNLAENHLERHKTMLGYLEAKARIFLGAESAVLNGDDPYFEQFRRAVSGECYLFAEERLPEGERGIIYRRKEDTLTFINCFDGESFPCSEFRLLGIHNRLNLAATILAGRILGASGDGCRRLIREAQPLEHRLEVVGEGKGVLYINDSKATTPASATAVLRAVRESYPERRIVLLVGGRAKQGAWNVLADELQSGEVVVGFGADGGVVTQAIRDAGYSGSITVVPELAEAVELSSSLGDLVLLAPGCASFDRFKSFEERGAYFKERVFTLL